MSMMRVVFATLSCLLSIHAPALAEDPTPRLAPLPESDWSPEVRERLGRTHDRVATLEGANPTADAEAGGASAAAGENKTLNILRTIAHHPDLLGPFLDFATALAQNGALTRRDSELLALRAAWNCQSDFEWGHHVIYARAAGLSDQEIADIAIGPDAPSWNEADRQLLRASDQLHSQQQIELSLWRRLETRYSPAQLVEIPFVVGQYTMLSMVANATGVELEEGHPPLPKAAVPVRP